MVDQTTGPGLRSPAPLTEMKDRRGTKFFGMVTRKERWGLSARGWLIAASIILVTGATVFFSAHPFLAITEPVETDVLVVEGWIANYGFRAAAQEFASGKYRLVLSTGGPVGGNGGYINDFNTNASVGADSLKGAGIPAESVRMVPSRVLSRSRTYSSAVALKEWLATNEPTVQRVNVLTEAPHARRTRLLFEMALGERTEVGIIGVQNPDYPGEDWWQFSEGVREMIGEVIAYLYAKLLFWP